MLYQDFLSYGTKVRTLDLTAHFYFFLSSIINHFRFYVRLFHFYFLTTVCAPLLSSPTFFCKSTPSFPPSSSPFSSSTFLLSSLLSYILFFSLHSSSYLSYILFFPFFYALLLFFFSFARSFLFLPFLHSLLYFLHSLLSFLTFSSFLPYILFFSLPSFLTFLFLPFLHSLPSFLSYILFFSPFFPPFLTFFLFPLHVQVVKLQEQMGSSSLKVAVMEHTPAFGPQSSQVRKKFQR